MDTLPLLTSETKGEGLKREEQREIREEAKGIRDVEGERKEE